MKRATTFDDLGSLDIMYRLIRRHELFLLTAFLIIENIYLLVNSVS